jgi:MSHA biogenesis protein MshJ
MSISIEYYWFRFNQLTLREKVMADCVLLLMFWWGWDSLFYEQLHEKSLAAENDVILLHSQIENKQSVIKQLEAISQNNPNDQSRVQLTQLQMSVNNLKQQLNLGDKKFVPAESMALALSDILKQNEKLKLVKLETLPVKPFGTDDEQADWLYAHTLVITLQGDYFSTLEYLKALEALPWRVQWDSIDYQVKNYPLAETRIQVYTLSFQKDWLGV